MRKIYVSGPMTGLPDLNFPAFFEAESRWRKLGWEVFNPARNFGGDITRPRHVYMREDIGLVLKADAITMLPGWENSDGAKLEHAVVLAIGLPVLELGSLEVTT